ncbi:hypothetical protein LTS18_011630 [Coniosporium uncinatum]|uniref:Uncharacterized protein n=1 Tax=Coniosporium uncinatum TaxID=93489 RepID=A0ACC3DWC9_9PEZI|nr:hypothetical protein LTS18_011630 [Coniosporium uncinatum]
MFSRAVSRPLGHFARSKRLLSTNVSRQADFTHAVIGGGAVGLAIAQTSSRNSEVIHAGIYYGADSLKTKLCLRGKEQMYDLCRKYDIPHMNCGKWIVAQDDAQMEQLEKVMKFCETIGVPMRWVSPEEGRKLQPDVRAEKGILESKTTGIVDSHAYMQFLEGDFEDKGGICAFRSPVTRVEAIDNGHGGWRVWTSTTESTEPSEDDSCITTDTLINSAGLFAIPLSNKILPPERHKKPFYAKGSYFSYSSSKPKPSILVYPAPMPGHGGLGTHLTLDMGGKIRFGPDVEWVDDPSDYKVNGSRLKEAIDDIQTYLPTIDRNAIDLDYSGIRPKLGKGGAVAGGTEFNDFYIKKEEGFGGFINLLGIESPGLTSSLAIGEEVERLLYR